MMMRFKLLAVALLTMSALLVWRAAYGVGCVSGLVPLIVILFIGWHSAEYSIFRRRRIASSYFVQGTFLYRMYQRSLLTVALSVVLSIAEGLSLALNSLTWSLQILALLAVDGVILSLATPSAIAAAGGCLRAEVRAIVMKNIIAYVNTAILLVLLLPVQFYSPLPDFVDITSLNKTIANAFQSMSSQCSAIDVFTRFQGVKEGFSWWLMLKASSQIPDVILRTSAWIIFIISSTLSVSAYSKLIVHVADFAHSSGEKHG